jgi:hypothetical protein
MPPRAQIAAHKGEQKPPKSAKICPLEKSPKHGNGQMQVKIAQQMQKLPSTKFAQVLKNLPSRKLAQQ